MCMKDHIVTETNLTLRQRILYIEDLLVIIHECRQQIGHSPFSFASRSAG